MGRSFFETFSGVEPLLGFSELLLEMTNPAVQRPKVSLGRQVQPAGHLLNALVDGSFDAPAEAKRPHGELLDVRVLHQLHEPGVLHELEQPFLENAHRSELPNHGLELRG